jgi:uncharacterized protein (TIGR03067 family)
MLVSGTLALCLFLPVQNTRDDPATLQGEWVLVETADARRTDPGADSIRMIIQGETMTMFFAGTQTNRGTLVVDPSRKTLDMTFANGRKVLAVFELSGDVLTLCVAEAGNSRPATLNPRGGQWREKWKRVPSGHD